jgi:hypothetical protein
MAAATFGAPRVLVVQYLLADSADAGMSHASVAN